MTIIGLTGMSGSGKTYIAALFASFGLISLNLDELVHSLYSCENACTQALAKVFGREVLFPDGSVNRAALRKTVFADHCRLQQLNELVHPFVLRLLDTKLEQLDQQGVRTVVLDAPTLFEAGADKKCTFTVAVIADDASQLSRIMQRDAISKEAALLRLSHQHSADFFSTHCRYVIDNSDGKDPAQQVRAILQKEGLLHE